MKVKRWKQKLLSVSEGPGSPEHLLQQTVPLNTRIHCSPQSSVFQSAMPWYWLEGHPFFLFWWLCYLYVRQFFLPVLYVMPIAISSLQTTWSMRFTASDTESLTSSPGPLGRFRWASPLVAQHSSKLGPRFQRWWCRAGQYAQASPHQGKERGKKQMTRRNHHEIRGHTSSPRMWINSIGWREEIPLKESCKQLRDLISVQVIKTRRKICQGTR